MTTNLWKELESITDQPWYIQMDGNIRNAEHQCPLCALADQIAKKSLGYYGAYDLALMEAKVEYDPNEAITITKAADQYYATHRPRLEKLLKPQPSEIVYIGAQG